MNKIATLFSVLAALLFLSALPAHSGGNGPYGTFGPSVGYNVIRGAESQHVAFLDGTGPYGLHGPNGAFGLPSRMVESKSIAGKDECLLAAMNCPPEGISGQQRIDRLNREISKGRDVYTEDELRVLKEKLNDANKELHDIIIN
jgi:hypothetical protein